MCVWTESPKRSPSRKVNPETPRNMSIHRPLPDMCELVGSTEISVVNPDTEEEVYVGRSIYYLCHAFGASVTSHQSVTGRRCGSVLLITPELVVCWTMCVRKGSYSRNRNAFEITAKDNGGLCLCLNGFRLLNSSFTTRFPRSIYGLQYSIVMNQILCTD